MFKSDCDEYDYLFKIVLIGDSSVGKSSILQTFTTGMPAITDMKSTIGVEFSTKNVHINDVVIKMQIWDTAGQERYRAITAAYYRGALGGLLVYDISSRESFLSLEKWLDEIRKNADKDVVIIIVGNKSDKSNDRKTSIAEAMTFCERMGLHYIETSALLLGDIEKAFFGIAEDIYNRIVIPKEDIKIAIKSIPETIKLDNKPIERRKKNCC